MSTIFQRIQLIAKSNINDLLDKFEDPQKIIDQTLVDAKMEYATMKDNAASIKGTAKIEQQKLDELIANEEKYRNLAEKAAAAGNRDDVYTLLEKATEYKEKIVVQQELVDKSNSYVDEAIKSLNAFAEQIKQMEYKRNELSSKAKVAENKEKLNNIQGMHTKNSLAEFNKAADKIDANIAKQEALATLNESEATVEEDLNAKYSKPNIDSEVDELMNKFNN